ncbi:hypothetical protein NP233_g7484 [Leucocoprinus birnbaumii]|uniref:Survival protein SurE-like phosphatase/nucleotidase domain-containing protein n=1 Tax=Leucocoprinus birnbaumii TaxID=56174 RepID=A0AAD5VP77_9AGAR|nr:hypothetical protein NP233_g7484 [Leucocoprinus birnbaumii]
MKVSFAKLLALATLLTSSTAQNIVLTNDDGWAVAQIRDEYNMLRSAGYQVILSAPAVDKSGSGSSTTTPTTLSGPCQFNTCPSGSPATGTDSSDSNIHYVNGYPVDAVKYGIQNFAQSRWGKKPDFVVSGSNLGNNLGSGITGSGTVGAASEAAKEGVPSFAFSGASGSSVIYTTLTSSPSSSSTISANIYSTLINKFLSVYLSGGTSTPIVPAGYSVNINFSSTSSCSNNANNFKWVATRLVKSASGVDTSRCGSNNLPDESTVVKEGCFASVSVFDANTKKDASASAQKVVFDRLNSILTYLKSATHVSYRNTEYADLLREILSGQRPNVRRTMSTLVFHGTEGRHTLNRTAGILAENRTGCGMPMPAVYQNC